MQIQSFGSANGTSSEFTFVGGNPSEFTNSGCHSLFSLWGVSQRYRAQWILTILSH